MSVLDALRHRLHHLAGHDRVQDPSAFIEPLRGAAGLEIGGPSALFRTGGALPVYPVLARVDGVQFSTETWWHGRMEEGTFETGEPGVSGRFWILEGSNLEGVDDGAYDVVFSSHVLEHTANPIGTLREWLRVLRAGGHLLLVMPHKEGTFDHRRPVTPLEHLVEDERAGTGEEDTTHAEEILALHDLRRDPFAGGPDGLAKRVRDNVTERTLHHHVFVTESVLRLVDHLRLQIDAVEARWPHDIYVLAHQAATADNASWLAGGAPWRPASPFRADRA